ncbi:MAG: tyrosine-type recombinase/integrase [Acidobacteriota bacterium]|nr:tyrosine-type recombinase/integrase [Acidobacteriota bacterium]
MAFLARYSGRTLDAYRHDLRNLFQWAADRNLAVLEATRAVGKGNKPALIPLVPRTARTIDLAVAERREGPILVRHDGQRLDRRTAHRWVRSIGKRAGIGLVHPHMLRAAFIMAALDAGVPLREVQIAAPSGSGSVRKDGG